MEASAGADKTLQAENADVPPVGEPASQNPELPTLEAAQATPTSASEAARLDAEAMMKGQFLKSVLEERYFFRLDNENLLSAYKNDISRFSCHSKNSSILLSKAVF